jgi:hypothetical protein
MSGILAAGGLVVAGAAVKGITGAVQNHKASEIEKANIRPVEQVDPLYQQNVNTAQQMAQQGIPQDVINNQTNAINQNQAGAISALNNSSNPGANLASIVRAGNNASGNLNAEQAAARNKNTLALIQQRGILAGAKQNAWNYNYADKYSEQLANSQALRGAGMQNEAGAANALIGAGTSYLGAQTGKIPKTAPTAGYGYGGDE